MSLILKNVLPQPIADLPHREPSDIWETRCELRPHQHYLITAPSGKGKSTFLHIIYGLRKDFIGQVFLDDKDMSNLTAEDWATIRQQQLSIVFQDLRLFPHLSAVDNILVKAALQLVKTEADIRQMAAQLGLEDLLHKPCEQLSYGQRQRAAIIRALCQPFDYLLLDEPFSHLDEENTRAAMELILAVCKEQNAGMILVSLGEDFGLQEVEQMQL